MRKMLLEFRTFAIKGNLLELAVAFILGLAFAQLVSSFVNNIVMRIVAAVIGKSDFSELTLDLGDTAVLYGSFLTDLLNFLVIAWVLFLIIKGVTKVMSARGQATEPPTLRECPHCLSNIPVGASRCSQCTSEVPAAT